MGAAQPFRPGRGNSSQSKDAVILDLREQGLTTTQIIHRTGFSAIQVSAALSRGSEGGTIAMHANLRQGSDALAAALVGTPGFQSEPDRFRAPVGAQRLMGMRRTAQVDGDRRPLTASADPCPRCSTRGDHPTGCAHQRPDPDWLKDRAGR